MRKQDEEPSAHCVACACVRAVVQFDTLKDIGAHSRASTVFVPHSPSMMNTYANDVKRGFVQGKVAEITSE